MSISEQLGETVSEAPEPTPATPEDPIMDAILARMQPAAEIKHKRKVLIYSDPGAGKTTFAASAPTPLIHDTEDGSASINNLPDRAANATILPYTSLFQFEQLVGRFREGHPALAKFETYTIDTLSNLHKKGLAETTVRNAEHDPSKNAYVAETESHTENNERIRRMVSALNEVDRNIIILCHAKKIERKDKSVVYSPDFSDKLTNAINALVDIVGYMYEKEENGVINRYLRVRGNQNITAKTRFGFHPVEFKNPTWKDLFPDG